MALPTPAAAAFRRAFFAAAPLALLGACTTVATTDATFDGTRWQVTAIDGQTTPRTDVYFMQFDDGQLGARFGCNHIGGTYSVAGNVMTASNVTQTLMGCPEPASTFEREGTEVLGQPMTISWQSDRSVTLSNAAGSIVLDRL